MKIVLIGFRGTGKTTLGTTLANVLKRPFIDTDQLIVANAKLSIPEIFEKEGETRFRNLEKKAIASIEAPDAVIACGGGAILDPENANLLKRDGYLLWLTADSGTIADRIRGDANRPPLTKLLLEEEVATLLAQRAPLYERYADHNISTEEKSIDELIKEIIKHLEKKVIQG